MKATIVPLIAFSLFFCSCNQQNSFNKILNTDALQAQFFYVQKDSDTTLLTKSGMVIQIKKGTFESDSNNIKLEIKEALSNEEIVLAGLTTMSGKQALSSGGMLYINAAVGYNVSIKKEIEILVPTKAYNADMSVYEGKEEDGKIDWVSPTPLPNDTIQKNTKLGEQLFKANCVNCHKVDDDYTGPALDGVATRYKKQWIYDFIDNPAGMIARNKQAKALFETWKPTVMTAFPALTNNDIDAILTYANTKSKRKFFPNVIPDYNPSLEKDIYDPCVDSCNNYLNALGKVQEANLILDEEINEEQFFSLNRTIPIPPQIINNSTTENINTDIQPTQEKVNTNKITATFYTIDIKTFGWFNIDVLLKNYDSCIPSELYVHLQTKYETNFNVMLIIPSSKVFVEGGKLKDSTYYGFDETNGKIPLPQNTASYIIAFAEVDGKLIFGKAAFTTGRKQTVDVNFIETTKEGLAKEIKALNLDGVNTEVKNSDYGIKKTAINKSETEAEKLKPVNCDCGLPEKVAIDTTRKFDFSKK
jgi:cytochrome c551/c552